MLVDSIALSCKYFWNHVFDIIRRSIYVLPIQTMTEAEHNRPIPKLFSNRPSASAAEVFGLLREPIIFFENNMWNFIESEFHT